MEVQVVGIYSIPGALVKGGGGAVVMSAHHLGLPIISILGGG